MLRREILDRLVLHRDCTLVHHGVGRWRFEEIHRDASAARAKLAALGVGPGIRVGVRARTSYDWVVADVALQALGVSIMGVPDELGALDAARLAERFDLGLMLVDDPRVADQPPYVAAVDLRFEREPRLRQVRQGPVPGEGALVFSSGSTGVPKCIVDRDTAFDALVGFVQRLAPDPGANALLMFLPFNGLHTRSYTEAALFVGMDICLADAATAFEAFAAFRPSICHAPPVFYDSVARRIRGSGLAPREAARRVLGDRARLMFTGMSPIARSTLEYLAAAGLEVFNGYGSMEAGMISCCLPGANRLGSVGRPLRPGGIRLAPDGEIIAVCEAPPVLGFVDDAGQFQALEDTEVATGDLGEFDDDGYLWIAGRKKNVIITAGGHKVQPELLEREIEACPFVRKAIVFGDGDAHLTAVVSTDRADDDGRASIEAHLEQLDRDAGVARPPIKRVVITVTEFTVDNGLLTSGLFKPNRSAIAARFLSEEPLQVAASTGDRELDAMLRIWQSVLGAAVGPDADFFDAGGNSLLLAHLGAEIESSWGRRLTTQQVIAAASPRRLLALARAPSLPVDTADELEMSWLEDDVAGDVDQVLATHRASADRGDLTTILMTGATGFLGAHLLDDILRLTAHRVRCVVRGAAGRERLFDTLRSYHLEPDAARIEVVEGDLSAPLLGLPERAFRDLRSVVHGAAAVNYLYPYRMLRTSNVGGTREAARVARRVDVPLHYVSTLGVFQGSADGRVLDEQAEPTFSGTLSGGYTQAKWAAECLIRRCAPHMHASVHRPGELLANCETSCWNATDFVAQTLATVAQLGVAPDLNHPLLAAPVEFVSRAIALLSELPPERTRSRCFHLIAPQLVEPSELYAGLRADGASVEMISTADWLELVANAQRQGRLPFDTVVSTFLDGGWQGHADWVTHVRATPTLELVAQLGHRPPAKDVFIRCAARAALALQQLANRPREQGS